MVFPGDNPVNDPTAASPTVFIVDDDSSVRRALKRLVSCQEVTVRTCASAHEFLDQGPTEGPACVILDVRLPGRSGLDLQEELADRDHQIPIIFISGHGDIPMTVRAMKAGAVDFLEKPFDEQTLLESIHRALDLDRKRQGEKEERARIGGRYATLTPREREVMELVVRGLLNKQIGGRLGTSEKTIKVHRGRVMAKMEAESLPDLVRLAQRVAVAEG